MISLAEKLLLFKNKQATNVIDVVDGAVEFVSSTPMTITPKYTNTGVTLQYSLDGTMWTNIASGTTTPSAKIIYFRGSATGTKSLYNSNSTNNAWVFTGSTNLECNGKLDRLLQDTLGDDNDILTIYNYCFSYMFYNVTTLIKAPELPATTLTDNCYQNMFRGCKGITTPPELPATTLAIYCYQNMFNGCTLLKTPPELPATTLASYCYDGMFYGCSVLTVPPELPATTLANGCYNSMFYGCKGITVPPELPATTLTTYCYQNMFNGCTGLTTAPELPATTLTNYCYQNMFRGCTGLKLSTTMTEIYDTAYRIPTTGVGTVGVSSLYSMFENTGGTFKGAPTINTTYYTENTPV